MPGKLGFMTAEVDPNPKRKRAANRYWIEIKGRLYARLQYKSDDGKIRVKYRPISDKRAAKAVVDEMRQVLKTHGEDFFKADKLTFAHLADKYEEVELVEPIYQKGVKIRGRKSARSIRVALKPLREHFGTRRVSAIRAGDLKVYKDLRLDTPVKTEIKEPVLTTNPKTGRQKRVITRSIRVRPRSIASVNRELSILRAILNFAVANDWLLVNPFTKAKGIISLSAEVPRDRVLSFSEEKRLLSVCTEERAHLRPILICALDTAMRQGEIFKMRWSEVDFETSEIYIPQTNTKTEQTRRAAMTPRLRGELDALWRRTPQDLDSRVFGITNNVKRSWATACREAGIENFRFHDCRHTATTRMIASGSPHTEVMKITGHSQIKTFLRYLNVTVETTNRVASRLDQYVNQNANRTSQTVEGEVSPLVH